MLDNTVFSQIADKLSAALPSDLKRAKSDIEQRFRDILQAQFSKLDLVTREEFEIQSKVLARTRAKLEQLEKKITELES